MASTELGKSEVNGTPVTKLTYIRPVIEKMGRMAFPLDIISNRGGQRLVCKQCSSCHGCR